MGRNLRAHAAFSIGSDSSYVCNDNLLVSAMNSTGTQLNHRSHFQPSDMCREDGRNFEGFSTLSLRDHISTPNLAADRGSSLDFKHSSLNAPYCPEIPAEAASRRRRSAVEERKHIHDASTAKKTHSKYRFDYQEHPEDTDRDVRHDARNTLLSTASFVSTDAGEIAEEYIRATSSLRHTLRESLCMGDSISERLLTPRSGATSVSRNPSEFELDNTSSPALSREAHHDAAIQTLARAAFTDETHGSTRSSSLIPHAARRHGKVSWQEGIAIRKPQRVSLISSSGQEYGRGNHVQGYLSAKFVTKIGEDPLKEQARKRNILKGVFFVRRT
ncbi:hypothetical protein EJ02DRAFT_436554 [Clathrospora elynae]|uniref:Uncharacterized protein n=1 Tax=Clathrospora elynae TaxID=706981 RepID=A0A6A5SF05_9PLEO|nr:hypothetical protein EJ02DRAFT_436554 [Clathrospora elynae]